MTTGSRSDRRMPPGLAGPGPRSPRLPSASVRTHGRATRVGETEPPEPADDRAARLTTAAVDGDRRALAQLLTAVGNRSPVAEAGLRPLYSLAGAAPLVGIPGPPGARKSTLVAALIAELRRVGRP